MEEQSYISTHPLGHNRACDANTIPLPLYIRIWFGFPQKLFDCGSFGRPNEICEMADTALGLGSFEATTRYTGVLHYHSNLYNKLSRISPKITGFLFYVS